MKKLGKLIIGINLVWLATLMIGFLRWGFGTGGSRLGEFIAISLMISFILSGSITVLFFKDRLLKGRGLITKEIVRKSTVWFVSPVIFVITILFFVVAWWIVKEKGQVKSFLVSVMVGSALGSVGLYSLLFSTGKSKMKLIKKRASKVMLLYPLVVVFLTLSDKKIVYSFLDNNSLVASILVGLICGFLFITTLTHFLLAIIKKETLLDLEYY